MNNIKHKGKCISTDKDVKGLLQNTKLINGIKEICSIQFDEFLPQMGYIILVCLLMSYSGAQSNNKINTTRKLVKISTIILKSQT